MANLILYTPNYSTASGKRGQAKLKISSYQSFNYYEPYEYFALYASDKPNIGLARDITESVAHEWLTRGRRTVMFADKSNLRPVTYYESSFDHHCRKLRNAMQYDHLTCWISNSGTCFVLNEPYAYEQNYMLRLQAHGLIGIQLPVNISPYCGSWNNIQGALPRTRSFLICDISDKTELDAIARELSEVNTPAWNSMEGISHV